MFVVWYQDEQSGLLADSTGHLLTAPTPEEIAVAVGELGIALAPVDVTDYDLDRIGRWCRHPHPDEIDCADFLNAWNFFDDLPGSFGELSRGAGRTYDKLFWGNNLPAVTPPGEHYTPSWSPEEVEEIRRVMEAGLASFRNAIRAGNLR